MFVGQLSDHRVLPELLTLSRVVQLAVRTHSMASHISSFWFRLSAPLPPPSTDRVTKAAGVGGDHAHALIGDSDCCSMMHV